MSGFFSREEVTAPKRKKKSIAKKRGGCESCKAYATCNHGKFPIAGTGKNGILIVDGSVSSQEEASGIPFSGITQKYLRSRLALFGVDLEDCYYVHAIRCYIKANPKKPNKPPVPTTAMKNGCRFLLEEDIKRLKPKKIIALGDLAVEAIYGERATRSRIGGGNAERYYGHSIPDQDLETWVFPNYSPQFPLEAIGNRQRMLKKFNRYKAEHCALWDHSILKEDDNFRIRDLYFKQYLGKALTHKKEFVKTDYLKNNCVWIQTASEATAILKAIKKTETRVATDVETNMIKCYHDRAKLITASISTANVSYGFDFFKDEEFRKALLDILIDPKIEKIVAHLPMEYSWYNKFLGAYMKGPLYDTVLASHFLNPTVARGNSLKFNALIYEGVLGYDDGAEEYIKGNKDDGVYAENRMEEMPVKDRSLYCAMDSFLTFKSADHQKNIIYADKKMRPLFELYLKGIQVFTKATGKGFVVHESKLIENMGICDEKIVVSTAKIAKCQELEHWRKTFPNTEFNPKSSNNLRSLLFDILGFTTDKRTKQGQLSTDADVLETLSSESELAGVLLEFAKYTKILEILEGIRKNTVNGRIHPDLGLSMASTGRSNSSQPNFQNIPAHDELYVELIKSCLGVEEGYQLIAPDYSNLEVRGGYSVHKDKNVLADIMDKSIDPHSLMAARIFGEDLEAVTLAIAKFKHPEKESFTEEELEKIFKEDVRNYAKSPNFLLAYGGSANRIYITLWDENFKRYHKQYFESIGLGTPDKFRAHCKSMYEYYWERYKQLEIWRDAIWEEYLSKGYVYSPEGFRINGINGKTFITNAPIQGGSFAVALRGIVELDRRLEEEGWESYIVLQIHDSDELAVRPEEFVNGLKEVIDECLVDYVNENTPWLGVDMAIDYEYFYTSWAEDCKYDKWCEKCGVAA